MPYVLKCPNKTWRLTLRIAVLVLLAVIIKDVAADAACRQAGLLPAAGAVRSSGAGGSPIDPCASGCVPDCFCCCWSEAWDYVDLRAPLAPPTSMAAEPSLSTSAGIHRLPYDPPIAHS